MLGKVQLMASNKKTLAAVEGFPSRPPNALPAYQRIQSVIRKRIDSGQLQAGDPVPSERELAKTHHVSLMTARHALASLDRKSTRLNSSHPSISYAVFCLKKKKHCQRLGSRRCLQVERFRLRAMFRTSILLLR